MAKKRKRTKYVSKGERPNVSNSNKVNEPDFHNKIKAWRLGKSGYVTVDNPNKHETNKKRIKISFEQYFGGSYKELKLRFKPAAFNKDI